MVKQVIYRGYDFEDIIDSVEDDQQLRQDLLRFKDYLVATHQAEADCIVVAESIISDEDIEHYEEVGDREWLRAHEWLMKEQYINRDGIYVFFL